MQLVLLQYKNYFNREAKKEASIQDYYDAATASYIVDDYDFNPNDGVVTSAVVGGEFYDYDAHYDYLLVVDDGEIVSRWFIMDATRTRLGQYSLTLKRDVVVDNWDNIVAAPMMIEKATVSDDSPFIYNQEAVLTNQIKTSETLLKDETNCAWICGYLASSYERTTGQEHISIDAVAIPDYTATTINDFAATYGIQPNEWIKNTTEKFIGFYVLHQYSGRYAKYEIRCYYESDPPIWHAEYYGSVSRDSSYTILTGADGINNLLTNLENNFNTALISSSESTYITDYSAYNVTKFNKLNEDASKVVEITTGSDSGTYLLNVGLKSSSYTYAITDGALYRELLRFIYNIKGFNYKFKYNTNSYKLKPIANGVYDLIFPKKTERLHLKDAPYDMFCIPYGEVDVINGGLGSPFTVHLNKSVSLTIAQGLAKAVGTDNLYDLQLLPYCPMTGFEITTDAQGKTTIDIKTQDPKRFDLIVDESDDAACIILWSTASSGKKVISSNVSVTNKKLENQVDLYRLVSPNYSGQFEFNAAKNNGINSFTVDYTYLPYNPFIHISPDFKGLYGDNYHDSRGLICGGDFSVSYLSDAWVNYQVQNKNYAAIFDRQIQNMEVNQNITRVNEAVNAVSSIVGGAVSGGTSGGAAGAIAGGVKAAVSAGVGIALNEASYAEQVDYTKDMYSMNLENIQALPQSLAKTTAYNEINKVFPILEYYTCTEEEKQALANKIRYNGMTVNTIGAIADYLNNNWWYGNISDKGYIKGQLIQAYGVADDQHMVDAIANELYKGIYTKW